MDWKFKCFERIECSRYHRSHFRCASPRLRRWGFNSIIFNLLKLGDNPLNEPLLLLLVKSQLSSAVLLLLGRRSFEMLQWNKWSTSNVPHFVLFFVPFFGLISYPNLFLQLQEKFFQFSSNHRIRSNAENIFVSIHPRRLRRQNWGCFCELQRRKHTGKIASWLLFDQLHPHKQKWFCVLFTSRLGGGPWQNSWTIRSEVSWFNQKSGCAGIRFYFSHQLRLFNSSIGLIFLKSSIEYWKKSHQCRDCSQLVGSLGLEPLA